MRPGIELAALSDTGCQRQNNEDTYSYWEPASEEAFERKGRLISIADGMGGYEGGQEASHLAIQTIEQIYADGSEGDVRTVLVTAFRTAHQRIKEYAEKHPELHGMGTTCTSIALVGHDLYYSHVGDSRLYFSREGKTMPLTRDQSYVGRLVEQGIIRPEDAVTHPATQYPDRCSGCGKRSSSQKSWSSRSPWKKMTSLFSAPTVLWSLVSEQELQSALIIRPESILPQIDRHG